MPKKNIMKTPRSQVKNALRQAWMRSRERQFALKRDNKTCRCCNRKETRAKGREFYVEVHHVDGIPNWDTIIDAVFEHVLCHPDGLEVLCKDCHNKEHGEG